MFRRVLTLFLSILVAMPAVAQAPVQSEFAALAQDAGEYAKAFGVPLSEAMRRLVAQQASVPAIDAIASEFADRLAGIVAEHDGTYRFTVFLTGDPPVPDRTIDAGGMAVQVVFRTGAPAARRQLVAAIEEHQAAIRAALPSPPGLGVDARTGSLVVMTRAGDVPAGGGAALAQRFAALTGVPVEIRSYDAIDTDLAAEGGGRLVGINGQTGARNLCTAGFVVTDGTRTALATAAHCPDSLSVIALDRSEVPLTMIGAWGARYQDVQIHTGPAPMAPLFLIDRPNGIARPVTSWRNRESSRVGDFVCHRGERTGYHCAGIAFVDYAPAGDLCAGPCPPTWVAVHGPDCGGGDSGGPVFSGTIAFGLMKGASHAGDDRCQLYYYMSIDYLPPGWTLLYLRGVSASAPAAGAASPAIPR